MNQEIDDIQSRDIPTEFDEDFLVNNPSIVKQRAGIHMSNESPPNVNLPNNNEHKLKNFGLNENKRGRIKQTDL